MRLLIPVHLKNKLVFGNNVGGCLTIPYLSVIMVSYYENCETPPKEGSF